MIVDSPKLVLMCGLARAALVFILILYFPVEPDRFGELVPMLIGRSVLADGAGIEPLLSSDMMRTSVLMSQKRSIFYVQLSQTRSEKAEKKKKNEAQG